MAEMTLRSVKGSALTHGEMDNNFDSLSMTTNPQTTNYTVLVTDQNDLIEMNGASLTLTLCTVATAAGADTDAFKIWVKNIHSTSCTVDGNGAETIDGSASITLLQDEAVCLSLNAAGTEWTVIAVYNPNLIGITSNINEINALDALTASRVMLTDGSGLATTSTLTSANLENAYYTGGTDVAVADGGTGASDAGTARTNLGVAIGTDVQAYDADLAAIAALANTDGNFIVGNGSAWVAESGATARTSLGLTIGTDVQAYDAQLADVAGLTPTDGNFIVGNGTNFVAESGATARTSIGIDGASGNVAAGDLATDAVTESALAAPLGVWVELASTTPSGTPQFVEFIDGTGGVVLDTTYDLYMIEFWGVNIQTSAGNLTFHFGTSGGYITTGTYSYAGSYSNSSSLSNHYQAADDRIFLTGATLSASANNDAHGRIIIRNAPNTQQPHVEFTCGYNEGTAYETVQGMGYNSTTTAIDRVRFGTDSGTAVLADTGVIRFFGMNT